MTALAEPIAAPDERDAIWTTETGLEIAVRDLKDDHLRHIIFFLNARFGELRAQNGIFFQRPLTPADIWPIYDVMRREANLRQLSWI